MLAAFGVELGVSEAVDEGPSLADRVLLEEAVEEDDPVLVMVVVEFDVAVTVVEAFVTVVLAVLVVELVLTTVVVLRADDDPWVRAIPDVVEALSKSSQKALMSLFQSCLD